MKKLHSLKFAVVMVLWTCSAFAQNLSFQIQVGNEGTSNHSSMMIHSAKNLVAIKPIAGPLVGKSIIIDLAASKQHVLMTNKGQQTAMMVRPFNSNDHMQSAGDLKVSNTGETVTIDGITCEKLIVESSTSQWTVCVTNQVAMSYLQFANIFNSTKGTPAASPLMPLTDKIQGFPMSIQSTNGTGSTTNVTVSGISTKAVDAKTFSMAGYKVVDMTKPAR